MEIFILKNALSQTKPAFWPVAENNFCPVFLQPRFLAYYLLFFLALRLVAFPFYFFLPQTSFFADVTSTMIFELTNSERQTLGLLPLRESVVLNQAALNKAQDMLGKGYFGHTSPEGVTPWYWFKEAGYSYRAAGENLAIGFLDSGEVVRAWQGSSSHRQNLLSTKYQETGVAVLSGNFQGNATTLVVQLFGSPRAKTTPQIVGGTAVVASLSPGVSSSPVRVLGENAETDLTKEAVVFGLSGYENLASWWLGLSILFVAFCLVMVFVFDLRQGLVRPGLAWRAGLFVFLFLIANLFDKYFIISLIPHNFLI